MTLTRKAFELPIQWFETMQTTPGFNTPRWAYGLEPDDIGMATDITAGWGIRINLIEFMISTNRYVPENEADQTIQRCQFLKLFNFSVYQDKILEWLNKSLKHTDSKLEFDLTCLYKTTKELKDHLRTQFKDLVKKDMDFDDEFIKLIEWYCNKYDVSFGYAVILFYQCGRARGIGQDYSQPINNLLRDYQREKGLNPVENMIEFLDGYTVSSDKENIYLYTLDQDMIKCPFDELELYL